MRSTEIAVADDVVLVSIGDHFDYDPDDPVGAGIEGMRLLRVTHAPRSGAGPSLVRNHDASHVMELARSTTPSSTRSRPRALDHDTEHRDGKPAAKARALAGFARRSRRCRAGVIGRDYATYTTSDARWSPTCCSPAAHVALVGESPTTAPHSSPTPASPRASSRSWSAAQLPRSPPRRYAIRGYASTAVKHGIAVFTAIRDALAGNPWIPPIPAPD